MPVNSSSSSVGLRRLAVVMKTVLPDGPKTLRPCSMSAQPVSSEEYTPQRVLFTGGAGFIGSNVLTYMVQTYPEVFFVCFDNLSEGSNTANLQALEGSTNFTFINGNITSEATVRSVVEQNQIDTIMHFAAQSHVDRSFVRPVAFTETNVMGTAVLLKVAHEHGIRRFLHVSTDEVYGENLNGNFDETARFNPGNPYSASKAAAECLIQAYEQSFHLPVVIARPNNIFGPRQHPEKLIPKFTLRLARKLHLPLHGGGHATRSFLFVEDAAKAFDLLLRKGRPGEAYNIGAPPASTKSVKEVAMALLPFFGIEESHAEEHMESVPDRPKNDAAYHIDSAKIHDLGWEPKVSFADGLRRTVEWYLANPTHWGAVDEALQPHNCGPAISVRRHQLKAAQESGKVWYAPYKFQAYGEEEIQEVERCLRDGWLAPGPRTDEFERRVAELFGKKHAVMVNSGSSANMIGLSVLGMKPGDEVVTPACTFSTVVSPLEWLGLKPVFVDVEPGRYVPTVEAILAAITPRTKCLLLPNLIGSKPDWAELRRRVPKGIWLFEDSCDTITHTPESDISAISFYASHIITAGGLGGCIMFNDEGLKNKALMYRDWGRVGNNSEDVSERFAHDVDGIEYDFKFLYGCQGFNMKACEMNAAFGLAQLRKLDRFKAIRRHNINRYVEKLSAAGTRYVLPSRHDEMDWLAFPLMHPDRKGVLRYLESNDVQIRVTFAGNITRHPAYRHYLQTFPNSDRIMAEGFLIGAHHGVTDADVDRVCDLLIAYDRHSASASATASPVGLPALGPGKGEEQRDAVTLDL
mmetsp:Transcript_25928/g.56301  ORF Transcript_25928/g.56301 Transcript_25928/m.56301 type:complete len:805 (-) Transcript_25928:308-2722(-)|eukprot:CAMPEP_0206421672 /NCGR_PEP_ID=MMETSP0324_2-20121206/1589_1 /ASSEMBLY_ACC=CAM_ASM_000836 /TAXON_ID=2866 /ORGANISM="Crypthecodinium cohnii, Strain Seligo" /LENGTH=804 /DNA_ID=CAMNT_0053885815 /DNA_START=34 /DNA_END=2448 /DNA_ORIENTATION=+